YLLRPQMIELQEHLRIELHSSTVRHIQFGQPAFQARRIKLLIPASIKGIGEVHAASVAAHLDHLRAAIQGLAGPAWKRLPAGNTAKPYRTCLNRMGRV